MRNGVSVGAHSDRIGSLGGPALVVLALILLDTVPNSAADGAIARATALSSAVAVVPPPPEPIDVTVGMLPTPKEPPAVIGRHGSLSAAKVAVAKSAPRMRHLSTATLCMSPGSNVECEAAFAAALESNLQAPDVVVAASGSADVAGPRGAEPLHFQKRAAWVRRLETIGKEGIPFVRIPRGPDSELVVGIDRKGMLGFSLKQTSDR
jgi:hypothetical protein